MRRGIVFTWVCSAIALSSLLPLSSNSAVIGAPQVDEHQTVLRLVKAGQAQLKLRHYEEANKYFNQALNIDCGCKEAYVNRAAALTQLGEHEGAINDLTKAIELGADNKVLHLRRAVHLKHQGRYQEALKDFDNALAKDPNHHGWTVEQLFARGVILEEADRHREAIGDFTRAIALNDNLPELFQHRGFSYYGESDFKSAIADYSRALELQPNDAETLFKRSQAYVEDGQKGPALADLNAALQVQPNAQAKYYLKRALLLSESGEHERAVTDISKAIELGSKTPENYFDRGIEYADEGKFQESEQDFNQCIALQPEFACAYKNRAIAKSKLGDQTGAIEDLQKSQQLYLTEGDKHGCAEVKRLMAQIH